MTQPAIAVFDFDHTLVAGDSFLPFLGYVSGWSRTLFALGEALFLKGIKHNQPEAADTRTFIKAHLMHRLLAGQKIDALMEGIEKLRRWQIWNAPIRQKLMNHHAEGHHIVIASGGLDLYLPALLKDTPHHGLICTQVGVRDGVITGNMPQGNCVRERKAELVRHYLESHGPFGESWGYGNLPHDLPMLNLLRHKVIV